MPESIPDGPKAGRATEIRGPSELRINPRYASLRCQLAPIPEHQRLYGLPGTALLGVEDKLGKTAA
jgi:hypothetical protein